MTNGFDHSRQQASVVLFLMALSAAGCSNSQVGTAPEAPPASTAPAVPTAGSGPGTGSQTELPSGDVPPSAGTTASNPIPSPGNLPTVPAQQAPQPQPRQPGSEYPIHNGIITTFFWVGEGATSENGYISNSPSAWDSKWEQHFGGVDSPTGRKGFAPAGFTPKENPFYVALPYNDFGNTRKSNASSVVYWGRQSSYLSYSETQSICKNRWVKIVKNGVAAYAQWEDVGPYLETDSAYVFGSARPSNTKDSRAGLDVSPAVRDYLGLGDVDTTSWQFVEEQDVPAGPWSETVTTSQITW